MRSARSAVPVLWQMSHTCSKGSIVIRRWTGTCSVTKGFKAGGTGDVCEWWLNSTSADLLICNLSFLVPNCGFILKSS